MTLHDFLDVRYAGEDTLRDRLADGVDLDERVGPFAETPLHVAVRRRRLAAVEILLDHGAAIDARTAGGKTGYAHAVRRGFAEIAEALVARGADTLLVDADRFAVAVVEGRLDEARQRLTEQPGLARTGNPEEDRLLADVAGRAPTEPVRLLIEAGADLTAPALDFGSPLHQAAWFGQPANARQLVEAGAPLDLVEPTHHGTPLGWALHGARFSGGAEQRGDAYAEIVGLLIDAGATLDDPEA
ncbi:MAG: ankyrin repeat domain-containing protein, partial [Acidobacteriota bacterium]